MPDNSENNKRIAKNTLILYGRMLLTVGISFYTTRLVLANLGISDYGVYNVIGEFVNGFYIVAHTLTSAVGRFLTFSLGEGDQKRLRLVFSSSLYIMLGLSLVIIILAETIGLWFVNTHLNFPPDRIYAANWIYQFTIVTFVLELLSIPYSALVVSHERMGPFAFATIMRVLLCFVIALLLSIVPSDKLIMYGCLMMFVSVCIWLWYYVYCRKKFAECKLTIGLEKSLFKEIFKYTSWNFLTTIVENLNGQGVNILLNMFYGPVVNASHGVASQIKRIAKSFSINFMTALSPQITKSYARQDFDYSKTLVCQGAKFCYLLMLVVALPFMLETDFVLSKWLKEVPTYASSFIKLYLAYNLVDMLVNTSSELTYATGDVKKYSLLVSCTRFVVFPLSYIALRMGATPAVVVSISNIVAVLIVIPRIVINKKYVGITFSEFFQTVLSRVFLITIMALLPCLCVQYLLTDSWGRAIIVTIISTLVIGWGTYYVALDKIQRRKAVQLIRVKLHI